MEVVVVVMVFRSLLLEMKAVLKAPHRAAFESRYFSPAGCVLLVLEVFVLALIIKTIPYTEIDWVAYMQEVEGFLNGTYDYTQLQGDTGPLVYPAGFVYLYSLFYYITKSGHELRTAQYLFACFYLLTLALVLAIYSRLSKLEHYPPFLLVFLGCTAYRVHSIFVLRLFNDPLAMLFLYAAVLLFLSDRWITGCTMFSLAVSIKMNVLLFSPGLLVLLLQRHGLRGTFLLLSLCAFIQILLGAPFLITNPLGYITRSFDLGRQFFFKWTVNWRFLPEWLFLHRAFHIVLLAANVTAWTLFAVKHWTRNGGIKALLSWQQLTTNKLTSKDIAWTLFSANFIGVCFSRSLHYQFYVWYYHSLPLLLWSTHLPTLARVVLLLVIEYSWNVYPSTTVSSLLLHFAHTVILAALFVRNESQFTLSQTSANKRE